MSMRVSKSQQVLILGSVTMITMSICVMKLNKSGLPEDSKTAARITGDNSGETRSYSSSSSDTVWERLSPSNTAYIIFGAIKDWPCQKDIKNSVSKDAGGVFADAFHITNRHEIVLLTESLAKIKGHHDGHFVFSGCLSNQIYMDHEGRPIAFVTVMNDHYAVDVDESAVVIDGSIRMIGPLSRNVADGTSVEYYDRVKEVLRRHGCAKSE